MKPRIQYDPNNPDHAQYANKDDSLLPAKVVVYPDTLSYSTENEMQHTITGMAVTPKGRIYTSYFTSSEHASEDDGTYCLIFTSDDGGATFQNRVMIWPPFMDHTRTFDCFPWVDELGRLWIFYSQSYSWDGRIGVWAIVTENPDDETPVFTEPRRLGNGLCSGKPIVLKNGDWLFPMCLWDPRVATEWRVHKYWLNFLPEEYGTNIYRSTDKGETFERIANVRWAFSNFDESDIVELPDGRIRMMIRGINCIGECESCDGGYTWSIPHQNRALQLPDSKFSFKKLQSGNLILVCNYKSDMYTQSCGRNKLTALISKDEGATWEGALMIDEREGVEQPDVEQTADGTIYVSYGRAPCHVGEGLLAIIHEEDIWAGKIVNPDSRLRVHVNKAAGIAKRKDYDAIVEHARIHGIEL